MYGGRERLHILLQWEKTYICPSGKLFTGNTFLLGFNEIKNCTAMILWDEMDYGY